MVKNHQAKFDLQAEIDLPASQLPGPLTALLEHDFGFVTQETSAPDREFVSTIPAPSFWRSFVHGIPSQLRWRIIEVSPTRSTIQFNVNWKARHRVLLHVVSLVLALWLFCDQQVVQASRMPILIILSLAYLPICMGFFLPLLTLHDRFIRFVIRRLDQLFRGEVVETKCRPAVKALFPVLVFIIPLAIYAVMSVVRGDPGTRDMDARVLPVTLLGILWLGIIGWRSTVSELPFMHCISHVANAGFMLLIAGTFMVVPFSYLTTQKEPYYLSAAAKRIIIEGNSAPGSVPVDQKVLTSCIMYLCGVSLGICIIQLGLYVLLFGFLVGLSSSLFRNFVGGRGGPWQRNIRNAFLKHEEELRNTQSPLSPSWAIKIGIVGTWLFCSLLCWRNIGINLSVINAAVAPHLSILSTKAGNAMADRTLLYAHAWAGPHASPMLVLGFRFLFLLPFLAVMTFFLYLHARWFLRARNAARTMVPLDHVLSKRIHEIGLKMGGPKIDCFLAGVNDVITPRAEISGFYPRAKIILTKASLEFFEAFPEFFDLIIAHEVAHLKHDLKWSWLYRFLSRLSLAGAGFLSVLSDSVANEDRADQEARKYRNLPGPTGDLVGEAAMVMEKCELWREPSDTDSGLRPSFVSAHFVAQGPGELSIKRRIIQALRIAYEFYFDTEIYHYVHRQAKYRTRTQK